MVGSADGSTPVVAGFRLLHPVGAGGSGHVWAARRAFDSRLFAVKVAGLHSYRRMRDQALRELGVLSSLRVDDRVLCTPRCRWPTADWRSVLDLLDVAASVGSSPPVGTCFPARS